MASNFLLRFSQTDSGTNLLTQAEYLADAQRLTGNQPGTARAKLVNKVLRQTSLLASSLGLWIAGNQATDVVDTLTDSELKDLYDAAFAARFSALLAAAQVQQPGSMMNWPVQTVPAGWVKRNGAALSRTTYAALFAVLGTTYGAGDGSTTFNVPDDRGLFERGWDDGRGLDTGRVFGSQQAGQNLSHNHTGSTATTGSHTHVPAGGQFSVTGSGFSYGGGGASLTTTSSTAAAGDHSHAVTINSSGGTEARPINRAYLPIIKF